MESRPDFRFDPSSTDMDWPDDMSDLDFSSMNFSDPSVVSKIFGKEVPHMTLAELRRTSQRLSASISSSYETLRAILARHELTIQQRWSKKKRHQRIGILTSAWGGDMPAAHRPDFEAFRKQSGQLTDTAGKYKDHYVWPFINQEDLLKPKNLLLLLNARGRHHPCEFAAADNEAMHLGLVTKKIVPVFLNGHAMVMNGAYDAESYGKLLAWEDHPDCFDWMHTRRQFLPGEGLLVLESQERTLGFLVKCCESILHDIPPATLTTDAFPVVEEPRLAGETPKDGFASLTVMAEEAPYRVPARLDVDRIESLLQAKASAAADHVWSLREDPGYFAEQLAEVSEHRQEMLKDTNGHLHPALKRGKEHLFLTRALRETVINSYLELEVFSELHRQAKELRSLHARYATSLSPTGDLPEELLHTILKFRHYLDQAAKGPLTMLKQSVVASPPMRKFFCRLPPVDGDPVRINVMSKSGVKMNKVEAQLVWLLRTLWEDGEHLYFIRLPLVLDELDRLLEAEPQAKELVSAHVAAMIGNLAVLSQCINQIDLFQPWARGYEAALVDREAGIKDEFARRTAPWAEMLNALEGDAITQAKLGDPSDNRFSYPSEKRRTQATTAAMISAERSLDAFWAYVDRRMRARITDVQSTAVWRLISQDRALQRTPEWVEEPTTATIERKQTRPSHDPSPTTPFGGYGDSRKDTDRTTQTPKAKVKTRGAPSQEPLGDAAPVPPADVAARGDGVALVHVDARSLKVMRTLFFDPTVTSHPGEIAWKDFLHALTSTGWFTAEKLYGSVWQFQRVNGPDQSRVQFHEPHPHGKIPFTTARRHGRRLNRHYGWTRDMFVLKQSP
ncbi:hypothetical protein CSUB01_04297 [Colletotrichum sublineola]|uniref:Uncharacterized protein n=1 Tax=Colletotrichum sublineola TaxID=1173701 RepID=A0A066XAJ2_COLSU|nr:hypothetical protein CSUB01_04297 [Colletotrichum sublineola]